MAKSRGSVVRADKHIALLKAIVRSERQRAESNPLDRRNLTFGVVEQGSSRPEAEESIKDAFNYLEILIDHLHVTHMAASFEKEAKAKIATQIGEARSAIRAKRGNKGDWPTRLVRAVDQYEGLAAIESLVTLSTDEAERFEQVRECRNQFSHGEHLANVPAISAEDARTTLLDMLTQLG